MTTEKLLKQEEIVRPILEQFPETRGDDFLLYAEVLKECRPDLVGLAVTDFFVAHKELHCPSYESISRVRRRLQAKHPELTSPKVRARRTEETAAYIGYALER